MARGAGRWGVALGGALVAVAWLVGGDRDPRRPPAAPRDEQRSGRPIAHGPAARQEGPLAAAARPPELAQVGGKVQDPVGRGVACAQVVAAPRGAGLPVVGRSDSTGSFLLRLPPGDWILSARGEGARAREPVELALAPGAREVLYLTLVREYDLRGRVRSGSGRPVAGSVSVALLQGGQWRQVRATRTGPDGAFVVPGLLPQLYRVTVRTATGRPCELTARVGPGARPLDVVIPAPTSLVGWVRGPDGAAVPDARIELQSPGGLRASTTSHANGSYSLSLKAGGALVLEASTRDRDLLLRQDLDLPGGENRLDLVLRRAHTVDVVTTTGGRPLSSTALLLSSGTGRSFHSGEGQNGRARFRVWGGSFVLKLHLAQAIEFGAEQRTVERPLEVPAAAGTTTIELDVPPRAPLLLHARASGRELPAYFVLRGVGDRLDEVGGVHSPGRGGICGVSPGTYWVRVMPHRESELGALERIEVGPAGAELDLECRPLGEVWGYVRDQAGEPAAGLRIVLHHPWTHPQAAVTDLEGAFSLRSPAGTYLLHAEEPPQDRYGQVPGPRVTPPVEVHLASGDRARQDLTLSALPAGEQGPR